MNKHQAITAVKEAIDYAYNKGREFPIREPKDYFLFVKYINTHFEVTYNSHSGDVYESKESGELYSEEDILDEWINNR